MTSLTNAGRSKFSERFPPTALDAFHLSPDLRTEGHLIVEIMRTSTTAGRLLRLRGVGVLRFDGERHVFHAVLAGLEPSRNPQIDAVHVQTPAIVWLIILLGAVIVPKKNSLVSIVILLVGHV